MSEVRIIKLVTGEELIAEVTYTLSGDKIQLTNPVLLVMQPRQNQQGEMTLGLSMIPYGSHIDGDISVLSKHVVFDAKPNSDLEATFRKANGMIELPSSKLTVK